MYKNDMRYTKYKKYIKDMRKQEIDGRYPSQYGFHNKAKS